MKLFRMAPKVDSKETTVLKPSPIGHLISSDVKGSTIHAIQNKETNEKPT